MKLVLLDHDQPIPAEWLGLTVATIAEIILGGLCGSRFGIDIVNEDPLLFCGLRTIELRSSGSTVRIEGVESILIRGRMRNSSHWLSFRIAVMGDSPATLRPIFVPAVDPKVDPLAAQLFCAN